MAWILLIVAALAAAASVDAPSLGYKAASVAIMLGACAASVYLADGPLWGPVVAAAVGWYGLDRLRAYRGLLVGPGIVAGLIRPRYLGGASSAPPCSP